MSKSGLNRIVMLLVGIGAIVAAYVGYRILVFEQTETKGNTTAVTSFDIGIQENSNAVQPSAPEVKSDESSTKQLGTSVKQNKAANTGGKPKVTEQNKNDVQDTSANAVRDEETAALLRSLKNELTATFDEVNAIIDYKSGKGE